jgi:hypothetical protein
MATTVIRVVYSSIDGAKEIQRFGTIAGASEFARKWVGDHPRIGSAYATSNDGIGKIEVAGANLKELFPAKT